MKTVIFFVLFARSVLSSFCFDLSSLEDPNDEIQRPNIIISGNIEAAREIGYKRPVERVDGTREDQPSKAPKIEEVVIEPQVAVVAAKPSQMFTKIDPKMTPEQIIESEIALGPKMFAKRVVAFKKAVRFIIANDKQGFLNFEDEFKANFNKLYKKFSRNGIERYLLLFIILFGAHDIMDYFVSYIFDISNFEEYGLDVIKYLASTKPFIVVMKTIYKGGLYSFDTQQNQVFRNEVIKIIIERFPNLDYFERFVLHFVFSRINNEFVDILDLKTETEKAKFLAPFANDRCFHRSLLPHFQRFPVEKQEFYLNLEETERFYFAESVVLTDDDNILSTIFTIDPEILLFTMKDPTPNRWLSRGDRSLFIAAAKSNAPKCFELMLDLAPEVITQDLFEPDFCPIRAAIAKSNESTSCLEILMAKGLDLNKKFDNVTKNGVTMNKPLNLLQYSFFMGYSAAFAYFYSKTEVKAARAYIYEVFSKNNQIVKHMIEHFKDDVTLKVTGDLGINLKSKTFETDYGKKGNASIFIQNDKKLRCAALKLA